ncbi:MAG: phosphoribosylamine--glycine ligase [Alphaproteobacteria bacterium]|nr:phosphoribosylamine--glycine ligase [Alphaproteobacteria bacterium]
MNVIVIGSGAREHALCRLISKSYLCDQLYCFPGNYGISQIAICRDISSIEEITNECKNIKPDLIVIGPENYLSENLAGKLRDLNFNVFGPDEIGAKLESSKKFMKEFCKSYDIPTAKSETFTNFNDAKNYLDFHDGPIVVKYDGLAAGKGVFVCDNKHEAIDACEKIFVQKFFNHHENTVIIEECLKGKELSYFTITDGKDYLNFESAQDYKRIGEGDTGPNTGGMGTVSPAPILDEQLEDKINNQIVKKTIDGLQKEKINFQGVIFFGIMVDNLNQPYLLEYNTRFGDPEIQSISLRLKSDFLHLIHASATKNLSFANLEFYQNKKSICLILASKGYPEDYNKNTHIKNLNEFENSDNFYIFHAATKIQDNKVLANGGRVLSIVSLKNSYADCRKEIFDVAEKIDWEFKYYRKDIGANY